MNKLHYTLYLVIFLCFVGQSGAKELSIEDIKKSIDSIKYYQATLVAKSYPPDMPTFDPTRFIEAKSEIYGESGKKLKILTLVKETQIGTEMEIQLVYDGTWLWVQQNVIKSSLMKEKKPMLSAMKIHIASVSPDPVKKPFHAFYGISGTGLMRDEDLPGTFYKLLNEYDFKPAKETGDENNTVRRLG